MKELFDSFPHIDFTSSKKIDFFVDTCFLRYICSHHLEKDFLSFCSHNLVAVTSFTVEELVFHHNTMSTEQKTHLRHVLKKKPSLIVVDIPVSPGNGDLERSFVSSMDSRFLSLVRDPSDAVLFAVAVNYSADILTRDKHHLFNSLVENGSSDYNIRIWNMFPGDI
ncbi:MAG: hypothetical protein ACQESC_00340 [Nanobdellota archaeon]